MLRLPLHVVVSFLGVDVVAFAVVVRCAMAGDGHAGRWAAALAAGALALGATAAVCERTWGVGLMLAAASAFFTAAVLGMGSPFFLVVAAIGAVPFLFTMKHMARFHLGATALFAGLSGALGLTGALAWSEVAPALVPIGL
jgi:hypothetical protein